MADDIVTRLRHIAWAANEREPYADAAREAADEIERLRAAGDALVAAIRNHDLTEAHLKAWEDAGRG